MMWQLAHAAGSWPKYDAPLANTKVNAPTPNIAPTTRTVANATQLKRTELLRFEQSCIQRELHELGPVCEPEFFHDACAVCVHSLRRDEKLLTDFAGAEAVHGLLQHIAFPLGELLQRVSAARVGFGLESLQQE